MNGCARNVVYSAAAAHHTAPCSLCLHARPDRDGPCLKLDPRGVGSTQREQMKLARERGTPCLGVVHPAWRLDIKQSSRYCHRHAGLLCGFRLTQAPLCRRRRRRLPPDRLGDRGADVSPPGGLMRSPPPCCAALWGAMRHMQADIRYYRPASFGSALPPPR